MKALLKYEFRKTSAAKLMILGIAACAELAFLCGLYLFGKDPDNNVTVISAMILAFTAIGGVIFIWIQSVLTLHRDMNTKQGYMLYMTPRNSFQILGAKMLENGFSLLFAGAFFFLLGFLDVTLLLQRMGSLSLLWDFLSDMLRSINTKITIDVRSVLALVLSMLASWMATVSTAFLADIVSAALLNGKKYNGILSFLFFIALNVLMNWILRQFSFSGVSAVGNLYIESAVAVVYAAIMYVISALVMEKYLSV